MTTITMPTSFESSLKSMCEDAVSQAVGVLASKHGFPLEEALRELNLGEIKLVKKRGPSPKTEKTKKTKKTKDPNAPKRAATGYQLFSKDERPAAKQHLIEQSDDEKVAPQEIMRELAARWKALSSDEQKPWNELASQAKAAAKTTVGKTSDSEAESEDKSCSEANDCCEPSEPEPEPQPEPEPPKPKKKEKSVESLGYVLFAKQTRAAIKKELQADDQKATATAITKLTKEKWNALDEAERESLENQIESDED